MVPAVTSYSTGNSKTPGSKWKICSRVKSIGVSNSSQKKLEEEILPCAAVVPAVDQVGLVELFPLI